MTHLLPSPLTGGGCGGGTDFIPPPLHPLPWWEGRFIEAWQERWISKPKEYWWWAWPEQE
jgi:hypothetical protein